jgi:multidrug efflux pump subunit AcrA (membrane-fusion protein)
MTFAPLRRCPARHPAAAIAAATLVAALAAAWPAWAADNDVNPDLAVTVTTAKQMCFVDTLQVTGVLVPRNEILVRPEREGLQIADVLVEPGASVTNGQALARLVSPEGSKNTGTVTLQAPASGVVNTVTAVIGTMASPQAPPLFSIVKGGEMELLAEAQGSALSRLAINQTAKVEIIGAGELPGRVRMASTAINPQTQLGTVNVFVGSNPRLRIGAFGRATIDLGRSCNPAVPLSAVLYGSDGTVVQVVRDSRVETKGVTVGLIQAGQAEISEGLAEGEVVVARAGAFLKDGDRVRVVTPPPTSAAK